MSDRPDAETLRAALRRVVDPEVGVNIVDLGLVYRLESRPNGVEIDLTMTSPACPLGDVIIDDIHAALAPLLPAGETAAVNLVWEPPWDPAMINPETKLKLGW